MVKMAKEKYSNRFRGFGGAWGVFGGAKGVLGRCEEVIVSNGGWGAGLLM